MMIYPRIRTATVMSFWALNVLDFYLKKLIPQFWIKCDNLFDYC